jgi:hypothetical protein
MITPLLQGHNDNNRDADISWRAHPAIVVAMRLDVVMHPRRRGQLPHYVPRGQCGLQA